VGNHLGNVLQVVTDRKLAVDDGTGGVDYYVADVVSQSDYYPFGMMLPGRSESADDYRYGFNGMEKDDEVSGSSNSYDFGARLYNPRVGRWLSRDPREDNFPENSPYQSMDNSPIMKNDPNGESAIVTVDKSSKTIKVTSHMVFYGADGSTAIATESASDIEDAWNAGAQNYFVEIDGEQYSVEFEITSEFKQNITSSEITNNTDIKNNYIKVVKSGISVSYMDGVGANTGEFLVSNINGKGSTTEPHEYGHGLGLVPGTPDGHPINTDLRGQGEAGIMHARGTLVDAKFTYDPSKGDSQPPNPITGAPASNTLNPAKRSVTHSNLDMLKDVVIDSYKSGNFTTDSNGNIEIEQGNLTNVVH